SSAETRTALPCLETISMASWFSLTFLISGKRAFRASLAVIDMTSPFRQWYRITYHCHCSWPEQKPGRGAEASAPPRHGQQKGAGPGEIDPLPPAGLTKPLTHSDEPLTR